MRKIISFLVVIMAFAGVLYSKTQNPRQITVKVNEQKNIDKNVSVKFVSLVSDSRCPADVDCVWAGNAKLKIELSERGAVKVFEVNTGLNPRSITFAGYELKIVALEPRIRSNVRINPDSYTATFSVTKAKTK